MLEIDDLKEVFGLATNATNFINGLMKLKGTKKTDKDNEKIKSSGYFAQVASSGDYAQVASSGDSAKVASSGGYAQVASSGGYAQVASSGGYAVVSAIGIYNIAKAKIGSWITLAEYDENDNYKVKFVKTEQVDGEKIKEDTYYALVDKQFREVEIIDGIKTVVIARKKHVLKTVILGEDNYSYVFTKDGVNAHGKTIKSAYRDWLFKTSPRDMNEYENLKMNDVKNINYWALCYRTITGACSLGTENFIENFKDSIKPQMTLKEVIDITKGHYGSETFREFFER